MKKKKHFYLYALFYAGVVFISNLISSNISLALVAAALEPLVDRIPFALLAILVFAIEIAVNMAIPILAIFLLFRSSVPDFYYPSDRKNIWIKESLIIVLPGEICRFFACFSTLGHISSTGYFSLLPTLLFEQTYVRWFDRHDQTRQFMDFSAGDRFAYAICYLPYIVLFLFFVIMIFKHFWLEGKKDYDNLHDFGQNAQS